MPLQNRVTPLGELVADPARGLVYGNRGCIHDDRGRIRRHHAGKRWIACRLRFRGWQRAPLLQPGRFTELFFLDEATALAAGHRPCALCRHEDYVRLTAIWRGLHHGGQSPGHVPGSHVGGQSPGHVPGSHVGGQSPDMSGTDVSGKRSRGRIGADAIDAQLHLERIAPGTRAQLHHDVPFDELPDGAFVLWDGAPHLVLGGNLLRWTAAGYGARAPRPVRGQATVITPPSLVAVLRAGWEPLVPLLHPSALRSVEAARGCRSRSAAARRGGAGGAIARAGPRAG